VSFWTATLVLAASPAYLAARGTPRAVEDLARHGCIRAVSPGAWPNAPCTWRLQGPDGLVAPTGDAGAGSASRSAG
jgi:hypothetical protein